MSNTNQNNRLRGVWVLVVFAVVILIPAVPSLWQQAQSSNSEFMKKTEGELYPSLN